MRIHYYSIIEILFFTVLLPLLYGYLTITYDESRYVVTYALLIVSPVLSSCSAAYFYEKKYKIFIPVGELLASCLWLFFPHTILIAVILYISMRHNVDNKLLYDSLVIGAVELLIIFSSVILLGKKVNKIIFDWKKSLK